MGRILWRVIGGLAGLLLVAVMVLLVSRLWPLSEAQKRALAVLEAPRTMPGSNAYVSLATLAMEGTPAQRQARVDAYVADYASWHAGFRAHMMERGGEGSADALQAKPQLAGAAEAALPHDPALCRSGAGCLAQVRAQPQAVAAALLPQATVLARMDELAAHGHYLSPLPLDAATPVPALQPLFVPLSAHALAHVQGDSQRALAGVCRDAGIGRMLLAHGENLLTGMVGGAMLAAYAQLFADVLAELPPDTPLPAGCATALAPLSPEQTSNCASLRGEFTMIRDGYALTEEVVWTGLGFTGNNGWAAPAVAKFFYNRDKSLARSAETLGHACLPETWQAIAEDRPMPAMPVPSAWRLECAANVVGCILTRISGPAYSHYGKRQQDVAAQLRLVQAVLWLRGHAAAGADAPLADLLEGLPAGLRSPHRPIRVAADGSALETPSYARHKGVDTVQVPLPRVLRAEPQ